MSRNEEYRTLLQELEPTPKELETTVGRAVKRKNTSRKKRIFGVPLGTLAACFMGFILIRNFQELLQ